MIKAKRGDKGVIMGQYIEEAKIRMSDTEDETRVYFTVKTGRRDTFSDTKKMATRLISQLQKKVA